ncbi:MAG: putative membrane protein YfcA, partial [Psychroserpens sp.]
MFISVFAACTLLGAVVGFFAGLLGIGGGLIIVPVLVYLLPLLGISAELAFPMA